MSGRRIGNYKIIDYVGSGGFGSVFKAEEVGAPGRIVAIKELHRKHTRDSIIKQRFFQEAVAMARLDHPNLPRLFTFGEDNGSYYLVMEFISGKPLSDHIAANGPLDPGLASAILSQVLDAVSYAHRNGIIHRDLKPDNIMLLEGPAPPAIKVLDFGIARMIGGGNLTLTGEGFGTPAYMAPERIAAAENIDHRIDIYSAGIILFEMLSGKVPFASSATDPAVYWSQMRQLHASEPLPSLAHLGVPPALEEIMRKAAAKSPHDRYFAAEDMLADLRALSGGEAAPADKRAASLLVTTRPGGADVLVDDLARGASDEETGRLLVKDLAPGAHSVRVSKNGYGEYRISVLLEEGRCADLQVALAARATVYVPRPADTEPAAAATERISPDEEVTRVLVEGVPSGSKIFVGGDAVASAGDEGSATVILAPGTHELEVKTPSGASQKSAVTVTAQDAGSLKTVRPTEAEQSRETVPIEPSPGEDGRGARGASRYLIAGAAAALLLILSFVAISQLTNRNAPQVSSAAARPSGDAAAPPAGETAEVKAASEAVRKEMEQVEAEKRAVEKRKAALESEEQKREQGEQRPGEAARLVEHPHAQSSACASVQVVGPNGAPLAGVRVVLITQRGAGGSTGLTDGEGRWRHCGLAAGQRVHIRALAGPRAVIAARPAILSQGENHLVLKAERPPGMEPAPNQRNRGRALNPLRDPSRSRRP